ncbi:MAG: hypothetical protein GY765_11660 [bacterium]|nr:hypothetical protein [bacterium]
MSGLKTKLKPNVQKVKGARNYTLFDVKHSAFYHVTPEGSLEELKQSLADAGLTIETGGVVPLKIEPNLSNYKNHVSLDELQIHLNGNIGNNCWQRKMHPGTTSANGSSLDPGNLPACLRDLEVGRLRIEAVTDEPDKIQFIIQHLQFRKLQYYCQHKIDDAVAAVYTELCQKKDARISFHGFETVAMDERVIDKDFFFRSKIFNPCLGKKAAVESNGNIKHCLWSDRSLGNVATDNIKEMILDGRFDPVWKLTKDGLPVCGACEFRYVCRDCRIIDGTLDLTKKPAFCKYDPYEGL